MKKIETIWHQLLFDALEKREFKHTQAEIAAKTGFSLSTVNLAIEKPAAIGALRKESKFFVIEDVLKFLYFWGTWRNFWRDVIYSTRIEESVLEIEGLVPAKSVFACYSAARRMFIAPPADYDKVFIYMLPKDVELAKERFPFVKSFNPNFFVLTATNEIFSFGKTTTLPQTFVDLWNQRDWFAKDYINVLEEKINAILS